MPASDPVLIVGAGPTGLTAALELARQGIPVRVIEKLPEPQPNSRAIGVQARTLELLHARGLAEGLVRIGNASSGGGIYIDRKRAIRLDFTRLESRYAFLLFVSQAETKRVLGEALASHGVSIERGVEMIALAQSPFMHDPSPVEAVLRHADGRLEQARAPWLISAEGAHSRVRSTVDLHFEGKTLPATYALADFHLDGDLPIEDFHIFASEHGFLAMFPLGPAHFRAIATYSTSELNESDPPSLAEMQAIYDQRAHIPARLRDLVWSSWFHINSRMVPRLVVGRLLLGGDAAHVHSPAGGQGMNTGMQDMINLGWKLAMVMKGEAQPGLLDTYERDRLPVMRNVLSQTETVTDVVGKGNRLVMSLISQLGPLVSETGMAQDIATARISQLALGYRDSPLSSDHVHGGALHAGDRVPDFPVRAHDDAVGWRDTTLLDALDPSRFVLLVACPDAKPAPHWTETVEAWSRLVRTVQIAPAAGPDASARFTATFGRFPGVFLIRPDFYVGLAAGEHAGAARLQSYCRRWLVGRGPVAADRPS